MCFFKLFPLEGETKKMSYFSDEKKESMRLQEQAQQSEKRLTLYDQKVEVDIYARLETDGSQNVYQHSVKLDKCTIVLLEPIPLLDGSGETALVVVFTEILGTLGKNPFFKQEKIGIFEKRGNNSELFVKISSVSEKGLFRLLLDYKAQDFFALTYNITSVNETNLILISSQNDYLLSPSFRKYEKGSCFMENQDPNFFSKFFISYQLAPFFLFPIIAGLTCCCRIFSAFDSTSSSPNPNPFLIAGCITSHPVNNSGHQDGNFIDTPGLSTEITDRRHDGSFTEICGLELPVEASDAAIFFATEVLYKNNPDTALPVIFQLLDDQELVIDGVHGIGYTKATKAELETLTSEKMTNSSLDTSSVLLEGETSSKIYHSQEISSEKRVGGPIGDGLLKPTLSDSSTMGLASYPSISGSIGRTSSSLHASPAFVQRPEPVVAARSPRYNNSVTPIAKNYRNRHAIPASAYPKDLSDTYQLMRDSHTVLPIDKENIPIVNATLSIQQPDFLFGETIQEFYLGNGNLTVTTSKDMHVTTYIITNSNSTEFANEKLQILLDKFSPKNNELYSIAKTSWVEIKGDQNELGIKNYSKRRPKYLENLSITQGRNNEIIFRCERTLKSQQIAEQRIRQVTQLKPLVTAIQNGVHDARELAIGLLEAANELYYYHPAQSLEVYGKMPVVPEATQTYTNSQKDQQTSEQKSLKSPGQEQQEKAGPSNKA